MPSEMPKVYEGSYPYIFVCYAHADRNVALPIIAALVYEGYRVWWDDGIEKGTRYPDYIARHIFECTCFVALLSRGSMRSGWCKQETHFALDLGKQILPIYLEKAELDLGLRMRLGTAQAMFRYGYGSDEAFIGKLFEVQMLDSCLTDEGRQKKGVKPRGSGFKAAEEQVLEIQTTKPVPDEPQAIESRAAVPESAETQTDGSWRIRSRNATLKVDWVDTVSPQAWAGGSGCVDGIEPKSGLAEYSWAEIKELSRAIVAAGSDEEGLAIAKEYNLVDKGGRLQGERKAIKLKNGSGANVRILGFRHDELVDGGRAGISFEFFDVPARHRMNLMPINKGGWEACEMRRWLNDDEGGFLSLLPDDLRLLVAVAMKRTNNRGRVTRKNDTSPVTVTHDGLWLLSMSEVYGRPSIQEGNVPWSPVTYDAEGTQYKLYADKGVAVSSYGFCKKDGAHSWWLRSPLAGDAGWFLNVHNNGDWGLSYACLWWGVSPGFCF